MIFRVYPKGAPESIPCFDIEADKMKYDQGHIMFINEEKKEAKSHIVAMVNMETIKYITPTTSNP